MENALFLTREKTKCSGNIYFQAYVEIRGRGISNGLERKCYVKITREVPARNKSHTLKVDQTSCTNVVAAFNIRSLFLRYLGSSLRLWSSLFRLHEAETRATRALEQELHR